MPAQPYLTKSSYVQGLACDRVVWRHWHRRPPYEEPQPGSAAAIGIDVGGKAHRLFPGGVLIDEEPWQHDAAVARTAALMDDGSVPAIFEAAFEQDGVRIRADVLERLADGRWGLREVKSASRVKAAYIDDIAVQVHVLKLAGFEPASIELVHVNTDYVFDGGEIDWTAYFKRQDVTAEVAALLPDIAEVIAGQLEIMNTSEEPRIAPGPHCPSGCDHWAHCTAGKPPDWIFYLPRLSEKRFDALTALDVERIADIPADFDLTDAQERVRQVVASGQPYISDGLAAALAPLSGAAAYLDFEAMNPALPIYPGTRPYQRIAFQWSLHRDDGAGRLTHEDFLGDADRDPREPFARSLIDALGGDEPIVVYSAYEKGVLAELAELFPQHRAGLIEISTRLADLYAIVRDHVYLEAFRGSLSIKQVGKVLAASVSYEDLRDIADGAAAAGAYQRMAAGEVTADEAFRLRAALLAYCRLDTLAMVETHRGLQALADRGGGVR